jgi:putative ABC transport system permease protein
MGTLLRDLRFAVRMYMSSRAVTTIALLALSLGIGANIIMFTLVNSLLIHPLSYPESNRLVQISRRFKNGPTRTISYARFRFFERNNHTLDSLAVNDVVGSSLSIVSGGSPQLLQSIRVSGNFFHVLGVQPAMGRGFTREDDLPGAAPVVVINHRTWVELFNRDANVIGRAVRMSGETFTIVGVMPPDFTFMPESDVWVPIRKAEDWNDKSTPFLTIGRLNPGISLKTAEEDIAALVRRVRDEFPQSVPPDELGALITLYRERVIGETRGPLLALSGAVTCVLLIACANIANLLLARAVGRRKEVAIRMALGVSRSRMIAQLLTESTLLAGVGGAVGLALAALVIQMIRAWQPIGLPRITEISLDLRVLLFTIALSLATGIVFGLAPALQMSRLTLVDPLRESGRATSGKNTRRFQRGLVIAEIGLSSVLLLVAGLLLSSFQKLRNVNLGFRPEGVLTVKTSLASPQFQKTENVVLNIQRVIERLRNISGIQHAAAASTLPTEPSLAFSFEIPDSGTSKSGDSSFDANWKAVTPEYFETLHIRLHPGGRYFNDGDTLASPGVALVNEAFIRKFMPETNVIGQQILIGREMGPNFADKQRGIIGIVDDTRDDGLQRDMPPTIMIPLAQVPDLTISFINRLIPLNWVIETSGDPIAYKRQVGEAMLAVDLNLAASSPKSLAEILSRSIAREQLQTVVVSIFAGLALFLGSLGLYGVVSHSVAERQREMGIRLALGANSRQMLWLIVRYSLMLVIPGLVVGVAFSLVLRQFLASYLFGLGASSLSVYAVVLTMLLLTGIAATIVPAVRATRVDLNVVLRG